MKLLERLSLVALALFLFSCGEQQGSGPVQKDTIIFPKGTYAYDSALLKDELPGVLELSDSATGACVLLCASCQGRVLTSATTDTGTSFGWINYDLIASGKKKPQFNPIGGEERFWIGPEGGQFAFYFKKGDPFDIAHWQVPALIDTLPYDVESISPAAVTFTKQGTLTNYAGTVFHLGIRRSVFLLPKVRLESELGLTLPEKVKYVAYASINELINLGDSAWKKQTGLPSIWLLSQMTPSDETGVIIPFKPAKNSRSLVTDNYFGKIPADRLVVRDSVLFLKCDGKYRSKIGISPLVASAYAASYDFKRNILTILHFETDSTGMYVNSKWEIQKEPYRGDAVNAYNDGQLADGSQLGPFYEIESSSPVMELPKGGAIAHYQVICHFEGDYPTLNAISQRVLGVNLDALKTALHL